VRRFLKILAAIIVAILLLTFGWLTYSTQSNLASPTPQAMAALTTDETTIVETGDWLVMRPAVPAPVGGLILYPGANCDIRGYAPVLSEIAAGGYLAVAVSMPFDFAIFAPDRADAVRAAFPEIEHWVIAGHSMGGAMAGRYAFNHQDDLAGLIVWDSYPPEANDLSNSRLPVLHIHRATLGGAPPEKFTAKRHLFPEASEWVPIPGGVHMYFGSFDGGGYEEEWEALISRDEQLEAVSAATLAGLQEMIPR